MHSDSDRSADPLKWERIKSARNRLWILFASFLLVPFLLALVSRSDAIAMGAAVLIAISAAITARQLAVAPCPRCGKPFFRTTSDPVRYNAFATSCLNCGWNQADLQNRDAAESDRVD